jgi:hypothetical protein
MSDFLNTLLPRNQNKTQKAGFVTSVIFTLMIILFHFPFGGYDSEHYVVTRHGYGPCAPQITLEEMYELTAKEVNERIEMNKKCSDDGELRIKSFSEWRSNSALMSWFSSPVNTIISIAFSCLLGAVWVWIFKDKNG